MYLNININDRVQAKVSIVSAAELRAIQKASRDVQDVTDDIVKTGDEQVQRVLDEGGTQVSLVQEAGSREMALVIVTGNLQVQRVIDEGDTQVARSEAEADEAEDFAGDSEAQAMTADSWANAPRDTDVIQYSWDPINDIITEAPIPGARSAFHWKELASTVSAGLIYQGTWDSVDCSLPPTPASFGPDTTVNGYFYIIGSVSGDTTSCTDLSTGDWIIWSGDDVGDPVTGSWDVVNWTFDWAAITGVPENVSNALSRSGGTMTGQVKGITPIDGADLTRKDYTDALIAANLVLIEAAQSTADGAVSTNTAQQAEINTNNAKVTYDDAAIVAQNTIDAAAAQSTADGAVAANLTQDIAIALNTAKVTYDDAAIVAQNTIDAAAAQSTADGAVSVNGTQQTDIDLNTTKISYTDAAIVAQNTIDAAAAQSTADGAVSVNTTQQAEIDANNLKAGISPEQAADIEANNAKVGITTTQASDITSNNAKVGVTNEINSAPTGGGTAISNQFSLTQAEYDALTPNSTTLYVLVG